MQYILIEDSSGLRKYLEKFEEKGFHIIAVDIEAESNLHAYGERLCLIQVFDGVDSVIIDPFRIDTRTLKLLFENAGILKIMYDAGSDLSLLKNSSDIKIRSILDLRPAVDLLDYPKKDLHSVIAFELGIVLEQKKKYQKHNWIRRPLSDEAIDYALKDVIYLPALKDVILAKLYARKLLEPFLLRNLQVQNRSYKRDPEDKYRKISGYSRLHEEKKALFRKVFDIREKYAQICDMPAHNIIHKSDLISIIDDPRVIDSLRFTKRAGKDIMHAITRELREALRGE